MVRALRGRPAEAHELLDRFDRLFPEVIDPQVLQTLLETRGYVAFAEGDLEAAAALMRRLDRMSIDLGTPVDLLARIMVAIERRDAERLAEIGSDLGPGIQNGRIARVATAVRDAALRVLRGDVDALATLDEACSTYRAEGLRFSLALTLRARAMLVPDADGAMDAATEARAVIDDLGAVALLRGLPEGSARTGADAGATGPGAAGPGASGPADADLTAAAARASRTTGA